MVCDREVSDLMLPLWEEVGKVCVYAQSLSSGTSQGGTGRMVSSSSSFRRKSGWSSGSWFGWGPASDRMVGQELHDVERRRGWFGF